MHWQLLFEEDSCYNVVLALKTAFYLKCFHIFFLLCSISGQQHLVEFCNDSHKHPEAMFTETMLCTS